MTVHLIISGRVQGVGYRYFCMRSANEFGITGTVKNNIDGSVEVYASGEENSLKEFIEILKIGPTTSSDIQVEVNDVENQFTFNEFSIVG